MVGHWPVQYCSELPMYITYCLSVMARDILYCSELPMYITYCLSVKASGILFRVANVYCLLPPLFWPVVYCTVQSCQCILHIASLFWPVVYCTVQNCRCILPPVFNCPIAPSPSPSCPAALLVIFFPPISRWFIYLSFPSAQLPSAYSSLPSLSSPHFSPTRVHGVVRRREHFAQMPPPISPLFPHPISPPPGSRG